MSDITIGFVPRERFSLAAESLQRIFDHTRQPFDMIVVDCNIPAVYRREMDQVLAGRENVRIIERKQYLLPNQSKNLVVSEAKGQWLCMIENDVLVQDDWLATLITACEEHPADVAVPLIMEGPLGSGKVHFDDLLGEVREVRTAHGLQLEILPRAESRELDRGSARRSVQFMEQHCLLFRRSVFDRIGPYDEQLNTRDEIDLSLSLYKAGVPVVYEPRCEVHYLPPYPPREDEADYFFMKWDLARALQSRERIRQKWNLLKVPGDMAFVEDRNRIGTLSRVKEELAQLISADESLILVDQNQWLGSDIVSGLRTIPFLEHEGRYWGLPEDDATAIREFERLRRAGASLIVFNWASHWWFDYYREFHAHLSARFARVLDNERMTVFDLRRSAVNGALPQSAA